jgi:exosome complex protein LRP1
VDKDAAGRFIKHAIAQAQSRVATSSQPESPAPSTAAPLKVTSKMIARAQYERALEKERDVEEDTLDVYDEVDPSSDDDNSTSEGGNRMEVDQVATKHPRRQRPPVDPFAGIC